jgi:hypothetical protein
MLSMWCVEYDIMLNGAKRNNRSIDRRGQGKTKQSNTVRNTLGDEGEMTM